MLTLVSIHGPRRRPGSSTRAVCRPRRCASGCRPCRRRDTSNGWRIRRMDDLTSSSSRRRGRRSSNVSHPRSSAWRASSAMRSASRSSRFGRESKACAGPGSRCSRSTRARSGRKGRRPQSSFEESADPRYNRCVKMAAIMATLLVGLVGAATAGVAPSVRVSPAPRTVEVGTTWSTVLTVRVGGTPYRGTAPRMTAQQGTVSRAFALRRVGPGSYRASLAVDFGGPLGRQRPRRRQEVEDRDAPRHPGSDECGRRRGAAERSPARGRSLESRLCGRGRGALTVVAGNGRSGASGDGGPATAAAVGFPIEVAVDPGGGFAVVQRDRVRHIGANGTITTVGLFDGPTALAYDADGNLFVSEITGRIRRVAGGTGAVHVCRLGRRVRRRRWAGDGRASGPTSRPRRRCRRQPVRLRRGQPPHSPRGSPHGRDHDGCDGSPSRSSGGRPTAR